MVAAVAIVHLAFIAFVAFGGFLVLRWRKVAWLHVPAVIWGVLIELFPWTCPLTTIENRWRGAGYRSDFIAHYLFRVIYPTQLTRNLEYALAAFVVLLNGAIYRKFLMSTASRKRMPRTTTS